MKNLRNLLFMAAGLIVFCGRDVAAMDSDVDRVSVASGSSDVDLLVPVLWVNPRRNTQLHLLAHAGELEPFIAEFESLKARGLLGAALIAQNLDGDSVLHRAIFQENQAITDALLNAVEKERVIVKVLNLLNEEGRSPLHIAVIENRLEAFKKMLKLASLIGSGFLKSALELKDISLKSSVKEYIKRYPDRRDAFNKAISDATSE